METPFLKSDLFLNEYNTVYEPSEDTFILIDALEIDLNLIRSLKPVICVEIGCGSGIVLTAVGKALSNDCHFFLGTDVNEKAAQLSQHCALGNGIHIFEAVVTDLLSAFDARLMHCVDLLIFNPPYVVTPNDEIEKSAISRSWAGGENGRVVIDRFINTVVPQITSETCLIYLVVIQENKPEEIIDAMRICGFYYSKIMLERKCKNERLKVIRFCRQKYD
ncbi:hemK methyltransferase family member 2-like isoform X1 [Dinothrombium tinctorium]|uniref:Methyltransferase HEMK2 n=1 Tax=Dinothrombium tinctorium TaxID=1965070 RepID=A0A3S3PPM7_9ACAR|nr:hemK methyltransferase family member 2-like isoform X1 [Dinothrombium tinctorium]